MSEGPFTKDVRSEGGKVLQYPDKFEHREWEGVLNLDVRV